MSPKPIRDEFCGDNERLCESIRALIYLNDENAIVPHGIGGHARTLLAASYRRLKKDADLRAAQIRALEWVLGCEFRHEIEARIAELKNSGELI